MVRVLNILILLVLSGSPICAQSVDTDAPSAPTHFQSDLYLDHAGQPNRALSNGPGVLDSDAGGLGKTQTLSIRGARANNTGVHLEGIRLNPPQSGEFDFGGFSTFGLGSGKIIRGGYSPTSSNPAGEILLSLPRDRDSKFQLGYGSFDSLELNLRLPSASFSLEQSQNDFNYDSAAGEKTRNHNFGQKLSARLWHRNDTSLAWAQILLSDQELPGSVLFPTQAESRTFTPTLAYQFAWKKIQWSLWGTFQHQAYKDETLVSETLNRSWTTGMRGKRSLEVSESIQWENAIEWTQDKLDSSELVHGTKFKTPVRQTLSLSTQAFVDIGDAWLLNPRIRAEWVSDLDSEHLSIHPGIGSRYRLSNHLCLLNNLVWISRAPNFTEKYFRIEGLAIDNPNLKRQRSLQGDLGYEWRSQILDGIGLRIQQAFFFDRTERILQSVQISESPRIYQVQNLGTGFNFGIENFLSLQFQKNLRFEASYTFQNPQVSGSESLRQARHFLVLGPEFFPEDWISLGIPSWIRSSMLDFGGRIHQQVDLGLWTRFRISRFELLLQLFNLLGWNREDIREFPIGNETSAKLSLTSSF